MYRCWLAVFFSVAALLGCGGGGGGGSSGASGGGTLYVSVDYPAQAISLYEPALVQPQLSGFAGRIPSCSLVAGTMPAGLQLRSDCSIVGRATQPGISVITIRVAASGVSNTLDFPKAVQVNGPTTDYQNGTLQNVPLGTVVNDFPSVRYWTPGGDLSIAWSYRVQSGSLAPGLSLDPVTGRVSGTLQTVGVYSALIVATLQTQFGTFETSPTSYGVNVDVPVVRYDNVGTAYVSVPYTNTPWLQGTHLPDAALSNVTFSPALPPGLSVNTAGVISGSPTAELPSAQMHTVTATLTQGGVSGATQGTLNLSVLSPVYIRYAFSNTPQGTPLNLVPIVDQRVPLSPGATMNYSQGSGSCVLPPGVSIDGPTGVVSGTSPITGYFSCTLNVDITNNGVSWTDSAILSFAVY